MTSLNQQTQDPVRLAYVGCGFVGQRIHIPNFSSLPDCRWVALAEPRLELAEAVARRYQIPRVYSSHLQLCADPEIEAVGVSAPYALQGRIAEDLLRAGKHVFMEKPMAVSLQRGEAIAATGAETGARLMVGYMKRYDPGNVLLKQRLDAWRRSGEQGKLVLARNHGFGGNWLYGQDPNVPFETSPEAPPSSPDDCPEWLPEKWRQPYLGYLQQWTHNVNLLRYFLDDDGTARVTSVQLDSDGMTGVVVLDIKGVRAVVESAYTKFHAWEEHTQIYFEKGWLRTEAPPLMQKETPASVEIYQAAADGDPAQLMTEFPGQGWAYREEARHFLTCLRSAEPFRSSGEDTLHDIRLFEEIYRRMIRV